MSNVISINNSILKYRETPWDKKVFELETKEILDIKYKDAKDISLLLENLEKYFCREDDYLIYFRTDINNINLKENLIDNGYYIAETSVKLISKNVQKFNFSKIFKNNFELVTNITEEYKSQIKEIAYSSFKFSRFHEDPFVDISKSKQRYCNWIDDLILQNKYVLIYKENNIVYSFMFYEFINDTSVSLILGGSKEKYGQLTPPFWTSVFNYLKSKGVKNIEVVVSVANITIINLYIMNGFIVKNCTLDYHKIKLKEIK